MQSLLIRAGGGRGGTDYDVKVSQTLVNKHKEAVEKIKKDCAEKLSKIQQDEQTKKVGRRCRDHVPLKVAWRPLLLMLVSFLVT